MTRLVAATVCLVALVGCRSNQKEKNTPVYLVAFVDVSSVERYEKEYVANVVPLAMKHGGKFLSAADASVVKEGQFPPGRIFSF